MNLLKSSALLLSLSVLGACATSPMSKTPVQTAAHVDLPRYMGDWRVIANIPYFAERGCVDSIESYHLEPDGKISNIFTYRKKSLEAPQRQMHAQAEVFNKQTNAEWRIKFLGFIKVKYLVLAVDPDYQWALIAHPSRKYGWVLARNTKIPDSLYRDLLSRFAAQGYDTSKFVKVPQPQH